MTNGNSQLQDVNHSFERNFGTASVGDWLTRIGFIFWGVDNLNFTSVESLKNMSKFAQTKGQRSKRQFMFLKLPTVVKLKIHKPNSISQLRQTPIYHEMLTKFLPEISLYTYEFQNYVLQRIS